MTEPTTDDRLELTELVARYAAAVDMRRFPDAAALFVPDGVLISPDPPRSLAPSVRAEGVAGILAAMEPLAELSGTFHHLTGSVFVLTGPSSAAGRTTCEAHHLQAGDAPQSFVWHLVYDDEFVRTQHGWQFAYRVLTIRMIEVRPIAAWT
jgi:hypothetical protein